MQSNDSSPAGSPAEAPVQGRTRPLRRILVVEDDRECRYLIVEALVRSGFQVDSVADGEAGWAAVTAESYDLMITDNNMLRLSGLELVSRLRSAHMKLPVILASGGEVPRAMHVPKAAPGEEPHWNQWLQLAAVVPKPYSTAELVKTAKEVLEASQSPGVQTGISFAAARP